jgi:iron complex transport system substrate-binding protein
MVPSLTETLIEAGVEVVGRTRFCIHPGEKIKDISVVGGTKDIDWQKVKDLKADLLILDREENPKSMSDDSPLEVLATHIEKIADVTTTLRTLGKKLGNDRLNTFATRWDSLERKPLVNFENLPVIEWINKPNGQTKIVYVIWRDPWMAVSHDTFIGSVLDHLGFGQQLYRFDEKYPKINLDDFDPKETLLLFSSEPYPFGKKKEELKALPFSSALVDGESYSWFGLRSLNFLESL